VANTAAPFAQEGLVTHASAAVIAWRRSSGSSSSSRTPAEQLAQALGVAAGCVALALAIGDWRISGRQAQVAHRRE
jgi:hypothetical protein